MVVYKSVNNGIKLSFKEPKLLVCEVGECCTPIKLERGTLLPGARRLGWPSGMLLLGLSIPFPNAPCSIRLMVLFSRMRYPRVPWRGRGELVHKKPQIKGCSLCSVSPVLCWNGRNVAGRPAGPRSSQLLMNFKKPFSFKTGCWLTVSPQAKHSEGVKKREVGA